MFICYLFDKIKRLPSQDKLNCIKQLSAVA